MSSRLVVAIETAQPTVLSFITHKQRTNLSPFLKENFLKENMYSVFQEK